MKTKKVSRAISIFLIALLALSLVYVFATQRQVDDGTILIRLGHDQPVNNERHIALKKFEELAEKKSNGRLNIEIYPNGLLGTEAVLLESVSFDDMEMVATSSTSQFGSLISIFELPYLFDSYEEAWEVLDGEIGREVADYYKQFNLNILSYFENGFRQITANRDINSPEDLKGLKIRTPEFPISIRTFNSMGANPTPMGFSELYTALQQGTVDAQENPVANAYTNRFEEVQDYMIMTNHQYMAQHLHISNAFYESLPKDLQVILTEAAQEGAQYHRQLLRQNEQKMIDELKSKGMTIHDVDMEPFRAKVGPVYEWFASIHGDELLNSIRAKAKK